MQIMQLLSV